jgi:hypothetical protein
VGAAEIRLTWFQCYSQRLKAAVMVLAEKNRWLQMSDLYFKAIQPPALASCGITGVARQLRRGLCPVTVRFGLNLLVLFLQHRALARGRRLVDQIGGKVLFGLMYQS